MCRWPIDYSSPFENMCRWAIAYSSSIENMCGSCRSYSSSRAEWASSRSSYSSSWANMWCGWAIDDSSPCQNMCRWATFCSSSRENMCSSCSSRTSPVSYRRKELARATVSWSVRSVNMLALSSQRSRGPISTRAWAIFKITRWGPLLGTLFPGRASACSPLLTLPGVASAILASCWDSPFKIVFFAKCMLRDVQCAVLRTRTKNIVALVIVQL